MSADSEARQGERMSRQTHFFEQSLLSDRRIQSVSGVKTVVSLTFRDSTCNQKSVFAQTWIIAPI